MSNPQALREKAAQCRRLARRPRKGFPRSGGHNYLLELADRFEREAMALERRMAGSKPPDTGAVEPEPAAPAAEAEAVEPDREPVGTGTPSRSS